MKKLKDTSKKLGGLAITMRPGDFVTIGDDILIIIEKYSHTQIRAILKAPKDREIRRRRGEELEEYILGVISNG